MTPLRRFWPLDYDQEVEIYDNPSWDLPGRTRRPVKKPGIGGRTFPAPLQPSPGR